MVKTALPCDLVIAQKLASKLLYLVGFHFKTLRHVVASKPCQNINLADAAGCACYGGFVSLVCYQCDLQLLSVMFSVTCANKIQQS